MLSEVIATIDVQVDLEGHIGDLYGRGDDVQNLDGASVWSRVSGCG